MQNVGYATLTVLPSAKGFASALGKETDRHTREGGRRGGRLFGGGMLAALGPAAAAMGAIFAGTQVLGFFKTATAAASDLGESMNALSVVFGANSEGIASLGREAAQSLGLSNLEFNNLAVRFSAFAKTIAGPGGDVVGLMDDLTTRAADFASVMNLDVNEAAQLFQSGLAGESEPLRRFGIDLSAAAVEAYAYANGIAASGSELTEAQKQQARYGLLIEKTQQMHGDFANTSDSLANQQRILAASWADLSTKIGTLFLPGVTAVVTFANARLMPALTGIVDRVVAMREAFATGGGAGLAEALGISEDSPILGILDSIREKFSVFADAAEEAFGPVHDAVRELIPTLVDLVPTLVQVVTAFSPVRLVVEAILPVLPALAGAFGSLLGTILSAITPLLPTLASLASMIAETLAGAVVQILPVVLSLATTLGGVLTTVVAALAPVLESLVGAVASLLPPILGLLGPIVQIVGVALAPLAEIVGVLVAALLPPLVAVFEEILPPVADLVGVLAEALVPILGLVAELLGVLGPYWVFQIQIMTAVIGWVLRLAGPVLGGLVGMLGNVIGWVARVVASIAGWIGSLAAGGKAVTSMARTIAERVTAVVNFFRELPGRVLRALGNFGSTLLGAGRGLVDGLRNGASSAFGAVVSFFGGIPSRIVSALGRVGDLLREAGSAILGGFLGGLRSGFESVKEFVGGIGSWIAENKGPKDYDLALLRPAGRWIMTGLRESLEGEIPALLGTLGAVSRAVERAPFASPTVPTGGVLGALAGASDGPISVTIRVDDERLSGVFSAEIDKADTAKARALTYGRR